MRSRLLTVSAVVLAAAACVHRDEPPPASAQVAGEGEVAFTLAGAGGAAIVVPVQINGGGPYQFVLDTGATLTCIDQDLAARLGLPKPVGMIGYGATARETGTVGLHRIETLSVGDATASRLTACALDLQRMRQVGLQVDGLLGLNFLKSFKVSLDFDRKVLTLRH